MAILLVRRCVLSFFMLTVCWGAEDRINGPVDGNQTVVVKGLIHPRAVPENDRGRAGASQAISGITLQVKLSDRQQAELERLLEEQRDPSSPMYRKWLTSEEFGARFGLSPNDMTKVTAYLESQGFSVDHISRSLNWVSFSGTAEQVDRAFHTELHTFLVDGQMHFANTLDPSVPAALATVIAGFRGLNDFRWKPQKLRSRPANPDYTVSASVHELAPGDISTIYDMAPLYQAGFDGAGQKLVIAGQTDISLSDIQAFRSRFGLSSAVPELVLYGQDPGTSAADLGEADLDLEWAGATARNATIIYVYSTDVINSVEYAISESLAPVISLSYGGCEAENSSSIESVAQEANAKGITWVASSGDSGAAGCDAAKPAKLGLAVNVPASVPEVTGVGGTEFVESSGSYWSTTNSLTGGSALSYIPEIAWNDTAARGDLAATGGGASKLFAKPNWQTGPGVPADGARDVPDVSLSASPDHDGFYFYTGGSLEIVGGTSASTPIFAGMVTLLNQYLVSKGLQPTAGLGNINPTLYHLAAGANTIFHDVTSGNNMVPCSSGSPNCVNGALGYSAGPGYDEVTGLGSVDANHLVTQWSSLPSSIGTTMTLSASLASIGSTASTTLTATVKPATGTTAPTGTITFSIGGKTLGTASLASSVATLTLAGSSLSTGANTVLATYGGNASFTGATASVTVTLTGTSTTSISTTTSLSANPASISTTQSTALTATVKPATSGTVTFSAGTSVLGSAPLSASGTATLTLSAGKLLLGSNTIAATYSGTAAFTGSTGTAAVTVTTGPSSTTTTVSANPATIAAAASTVVTAKVTPATSGSVTFTLGTTTLGTATISSSGSAALTVKGSQLAAGPNTIKASYAGTAAFAASSGTVSVSVTAATPNSNVSIAVNPNPVTKAGKAWPFTIALSNTGGATTITNFTFNGANYLPEFATWFGSTSLPTNGKLQTNLSVTNVPVPTNGVFGFGGMDANGNPWTHTVTVPFH
jgi:subtilase family serine protease